MEVPMSPLSHEAHSRSMASMKLGEVWITLRLIVLRRNNATTFWV